MSKSRALVVVGKDEHLCFASKTTKSIGMQDAVAVAFEAGAKEVGGFGDGPRACPKRQSGERTVEMCFVFLALLACDHAL
jgi:hypothetical protein